MDHNYNAKVKGDITGFEDEYYRGRRPGGLLIPNFRYKPSRYSDKYQRGFSFSCGAYRETWKDQKEGDGFGSKFKETLSQAGQWKFNMDAQGEMLPRFENHMALHPTLKDKWGIPQVEFNVRWSDNEKLMMEDAVEIGKEILINAGLENVTGEATERPPGIAIHEVGTARMGRDPKDSILNGFNQCHDVANLFVTDGSCFSSSATQNPSLTFMALTARAVDYAAKEIKNGRI